MCCSFRNIAIVFLTLLNILLMYSWKSNMVFKIVPWFSWNATCLIGLLLKWLEGWILILCLREKMTSWACSLGSGLKLIFYWNSQLLVFPRLLFKWFAQVLISHTLEKREVSSAKDLAFVKRSSERTLT